MSRRLQLLALAVVVSASIAVAVPAAVCAAKGPVARAAHGGFGPALLRELNRVRGRFHLPPVRADRRMNGEAASHSRDMARNRYFAHGAWAGRIARAAGPARHMGEVIGWLSTASAGAEASRVVRAWLHSPEHRSVLLDGGFRRVGIGRAVGSGLAIYTVDFASAR